MMAVLQNVLCFVIISIFWLNLVIGQKLTNNEKHTNNILNDPCKDDLSGETGICQYLEDCSSVASRWKYVDQPDRPTICGFEDRNVIVCCPTENTTKQLLTNDLTDRLGENEYVEFNETCIIPNTSELGRIRREKHCPYALQQQTNDVKLPRACSYEICSDMVCCPDTIKPRLRQQCKHETVNSLIRTRVRGNFPCNVPVINEVGRYTSSDSCSFYKERLSKNETLPKICDWEDCRNYVCCPDSHLEQAECRGTDDYEFDYVDVTSGSCTMKDTGAPGVCTSTQICRTQATYFNKNNTICGSDCCSTFVCCPFAELSKLSSNERACYKYKKEVFEDTKLVNFIDPEVNLKRRGCMASKPSGGTLANPKEFPHMAVLGYDGDNGTAWSCGGSLISERFVLTAGHCVESTSAGPVKYVRVGIIELDITKDLGDCPEEYSVIRSIPHPEYNPKLTYNDIALLELNENVKFSPDIRPICLPTSPEIPEFLTAIGFGLTSYNGQRTEQLIKVSLEYFDHKECNESYKFNFNRKFNGLNDLTQFCAGSGNSIQDTCPGDSGGPIEGRHNEFYLMKVIYGITSFGKACGFKGSPAIYTTVFPFVEWIESIVWPN